jgi:6-phosphogluconolactonase
MTGEGAVSAFRIGGKGALTALGALPSQGAGPCYVSVDHTGKRVFVANYAGGTVARFAVAADGALRAAETTFDCRKNPVCGVLGPNAARQEAAHMHCATVTPDNRAVLACNLGEDAIEVFPLAGSRFDQPVRVAARAGSGPRHLAFHPNGRWVYCVHELDCTVDLYEWHNGQLTLRPKSVVSTLPQGAAPGDNTGCEVVVSQDGRFLYANTRGAEMVTVFAIGPTGLLTELQKVSSGGTVTRLIALDPSRRWMLCLHQGSGGVTVLAHNARTGRLGEARSFAAETPMCVAFV